MVKQLRRFRRIGNKILYSFDLDEWPKDIPLPFPIKITEIGDGPLRPYRGFDLRKDKTVDQVVGLFNEPFASVAEALAWHQEKMISAGWVEGKEFQDLPSLAVIQFCYPNTNVQVEVSLCYWDGPEQVRSIIERVTIELWPPVGDEDNEHLLQPDPEGL